MNLLCSLCFRRHHTQHVVCNSVWKVFVKLIEAQTLPFLLPSSSSSLLLSLPILLPPLPFKLGNSIVPELMFYSL